MLEEGAKGRGGGGDVDREPEGKGVPSSLFVSLCLNTGLSGGGRRGGSTGQRVMEGLKMRERVQGAGCVICS